MQYAGDVQPVRFNGTYDLAVTVRVANRAGNQLVTAPYRAELEASSPHWLVAHDTGYITATGENYESSEWSLHTWYNLTMMVGDKLQLSLISLSREESSFWSDFSLQFQRIRLTLNTSFDPDAMDAEAPDFSTWLYGGESPPPPPPPPETSLVAGQIENGIAAEG